MIACINYTNLSTAKAMERASEVGLRKVVGATRSQLVKQFLMESILVNCLAVFSAVIIVWSLAPYYDDFIGKTATEGFWTSELLSEASFWITLFLILIGGSFLIGIYPALITSSYNPIHVLKGKFYGSQSGVLVRKVLVGFQFVLAILLIAGSLTVFNQLAYMRNQALGYSKDQVLVVKTPGIYNQIEYPKLNLLRNEFLSTSAVNEVGFSSEIPGEAIVERNGARMFGNAQTENAEVAITQIDDHFLKAYQIELIAGRNFREKDSVDVFPINGVTSPENVPIIVNESAVKNLGFKMAADAVNKVIMFGLGAQELKGKIVGVVKDYHQRSLKDPYEPMLYLFPSRTEWRFFSINVNTKNLKKVSRQCRTVTKAFSRQSVRVFFLGRLF